MISTASRTTLSFYRYVRIENPQALMQALRDAWEPLGVLGRIYLAAEGVNAQASVPAEALEAFQAHVRTVFPEIPFKIALEERGESFDKLKIKVRAKLVSDGLTDSTFDPGNVGTHLSAAEFNEALQAEGTLVVDLRNHYEAEVGRFEGALIPDANTFREALPEMLEQLRGQEDKKLLLYCTGGIRCEKASAWFKHQGFQDVNQLHGGIIDYAQQIRREGLPSLYKGKNFVFDQRLSEAITDDVLSSCHQCNGACDTHTNCRFEGCNRLFIQCENCRSDFDACCSVTCQTIMQKPKEERVRLQHAWEAKAGPLLYWSKTRLPRDLVHTLQPLDEPLMAPH